MRTLKQEYFDKLENYINDYQQKQGYSPSISDMVRDLGIPQTTDRCWTTLYPKKSMTSFADNV